MIKSIGYVARIDIVKGDVEYTLYISSKNRTVTKDINMAQFADNMNVFRNIDSDNLAIDIGTIKDIKDKLGLTFKDSMFIGNPLPYISLPEDNTDIAKCIDYDKTVDVLNVNMDKVEAEKARVKIYQDAIKRLEHESVEMNIYNSNEHDSHTITIGRFIRNTEDEPKCRVTIHGVKIELKLNATNPNYFMTIFETDGDYYTYENRMVCDFEDSLCLHKIGRVEAKSIPTILSQYAVNNMRDSLENYYVSYVTINRDIESNIRDAYSNISSFKEVQMNGTYSQILRSKALSDILNNKIANAKMNVIGLSINSIRESVDITDLYTYIKDIEVTRYDHITEMINNYSVKLNFEEDHNV